MRKIFLGVGLGCILLLGMGNGCKVTLNGPGTTTPDFMKKPTSLPKPPGNDQDATAPQGYLEAVQIDTGIDFSDEGKTSFTWRAQDGEEEEVIGVAQKAEGLTQAQIEKIDAYFNTFTVSMENISDGTVVGAMGYEMDDEVVCLVTKQLSEESQELIDPDEGMENLDWEETTSDVLIECGNLDILSR